MSAIRGSRMSHIRPIMPVGPMTNVAPAAPVALSQTSRALAQAQITGAENNDSLQSSLQTQKNIEERKRNARGLIGSKMAIGTLEALEALPDMKGGHNEDDDPSSAGRGLANRRRRNKRKPPLPHF